MKPPYKLSTATLLLTVVLLAVLIVTGFKQYNLAHRHNSLVKESEKTIFLYATIREQVTEGIISKNPLSLTTAADGFERLYSRFTAILENQLIPNQYKLSFIQEMDLEQIVINLKKLSSHPENNTLSLTVANQLRQMNNQFLQFDRIVVSEMRNKIIRYQKNGLILMGLVILFTCFTLLLTYSESIRPLIQLEAQLKQAISDNRPIQLENKKIHNPVIKKLIVSFNTFLQKSRENHPINPEHLHQFPEFSLICNEISNRLNAIINYAQLLIDHSQKHHTNDEELNNRLHEIIDNGEKSAVVLQKLIEGKRHDGLGKE